MANSEMQQYFVPAPRHPPVFVPGDPVYEYLLKTNPKKLKRLVRDDQACYAKTLEPDYEEKFQARLAEAHTQNEQRKKKNTDYKLLTLDQVEGHITKRDVKNAYRRQSRRLHPDKGGSEEAFKELHAAYRRVLASVPEH